MHCSLCITCRWPAAVPVDAQMSELQSGCWRIRAPHDPQYWLYSLDSLDRLDMSMSQCMERHKGAQFLQGSRNGIRWAFLRLAMLT